MRLFPGRLLLIAGQRYVVLVRRCQKRFEPVIIFLPKRVEHVVVAASTTDRQPEKDRADGIGHFRQHFIAAAGDFLVAGVAPHRPEAMKAGRHLQRRSAEPNSSPANCSRTNWSYGLSALSDSITQSR